MSTTTTFVGTKGGVGTSTVAATPGCRALSQPIVGELPREAATARAIEDGLLTNGYGSRLKMHAPPLTWCSCVRPQGLEP